MNEFAKGKHSAIDNLVPAEKVRVRLSNSTQLHKFMLPEQAVCYRIRQCYLIWQSAQTAYQEVASRVQELDASKFEAK